MFPDYACQGADRLCAYLKQADLYVRGLYDPDVRRTAHAYMTAHLVELSFVAATESGSRLSAAMAGGGALGRPGSGAPGFDDWLGLSPWGMAFRGVTVRDCSIPAIVI
jgi:hypothetical protein